MAIGMRARRMAALAAFLWPLAAGAHAAQANWPGAIARALPKVGGPSASGAGRLFQASQSRPADFERMANLLGKRLQSLHPKLTPDAVAETHLSDLIASEVARAKQIVLNSSLKDRRPSQDLADGADAERILAVYPILDEDTLKELNRLSPTLEANREKALKHAGRMAETLLAQSLQEPEEKAPAPSTAPPLPSHIPPSSQSAQTPQQPQAAQPSGLAPASLRQDDLAKIRDVIRDIAELFTNDSLLRRPQNLGFQTTARQLALDDLALTDISPDQEVIVLEHLFNKGDELLKKYIAVVEADNIYGADGKARRLVDAETLRLRLELARSRHKDSVPAPSVTAAAPAASAPPAPPTPEMIRKLQFQGILHAAAAVVTQIYNDRGLFPGRREKIEKDSSVYGQWISFYWEVIDVVNFPKYEEHMAQMTAELVQAYKDALYSKRDLTDDELQSKRDAIEALEARVTALRKNDSQP